MPVCMPVLFLGCMMLILLATSVRPIRTNLILFSFSLLLVFLLDSLNYPV